MLNTEGNMPSPTTSVSNTGGNSQTATTQEKNLSIDTLSLTGKLNDFPALTAVSDDDIINEFSKLLQLSFGITPHGDHAGGMNGYTHSRKLKYTDDRPYNNLGFIAWGANRATYQLYLTGEACEYLHMIDAFKDLYALALKTKLAIKRIDIAFDDFQGEYDIDTAMSMYLKGKFKITRNPKIRQIGDFLSANDTDGRTVYIGNRKNGKMMRIYEKGKQLGDTSSPWVRWELELKAIDRIIPLDALIEYPEYYAGSYPALANFKVSTASRVIKTVQKIAKIKLDRLTEYAKVAYGRLINVLSGLKTHDEIIQMLIQDGVPSRLIIPLPHKSKTTTHTVLDNPPIPFDDLAYGIPSF